MSVSETQPLLTPAPPSFRQRVAYGALALGGLVATGFAAYNIVQSVWHSHTAPPPGVRLVGEVFGALGCLCMTCLAGKELFTPRLIQRADSTMTPATQKTDLLSQGLLQAWIARLDTILTTVSKDEISVGSDGNFVKEFEARLAKLESKIQNPDKAYVMGLIKQLKTSLSTQSSASSSVQTTPHHKSPGQGVDEQNFDHLIKRLEDALLDPALYTPPVSPTKEKN